MSSAEASATVVSSELHDSSSWSESSVFISDDKMLELDLLSFSFIFVEIFPSLNSFSEAKCFLFTVEGIMMVTDELKRLVDDKLCQQIKEIELSAKDFLFFELQLPFV